jgi:hypothetical protein
LRFRVLPPWFYGAELDPTFLDFPLRRSEELGARHFEVKGWILNDPKIFSPGPEEISGPGSVNQECKA